MTLDEALQTLGKTYSRDPGIVALTATQDDQKRWSILVYLATKKDATRLRLPKTWEGFPLAVKVTGRARPLSG